jgi:iron complex outermembrane receptor protein
VNIITRSSRDASGGSVVAGLEPAGGSFFGARYEGRFSDEATYRAFANYQSADNNQLVFGSDANDDWSLFRASFRADWQFDQKEFKVTLEGYSGEMGSTNTVFSPIPPYSITAETDADVSGAFLLGQWSVSHDLGSRSSGQVYVDHTDRNSYLYDETRTTFSVDLQHQRDLGRHQLMVGGWVRLNQYDLGGSGVLSFVQEIDNDTVFSAFIQDEIQIIEDRLSLTVGLKLEDNELSPDDVEVMPTVRVLWKPIEDHAFWAAVTRAVRTPSIADLTADVQDIVPALPPGDPLNPSTVPARVTSMGNPNFESESNLAYEVGMRGQISSHVSYDLALFTMEYENLRSFSPTDIVCSPSGVSYFVDPLCFLTSDSVVALYQFTNVNESTISGFEAALDWMVRKNFRLRSALSYAYEDATEYPPTLPVAGTYPEWQFSLRSEWSPSEDIDVAALIRYVDEVDFRSIDEYWQANLHVRWSPDDAWVASLGVRNLLDDRTVEYHSELGDIVPTRIERTAFVNLRYSF